jgi:hypothetical protein
MPRSLAGWLAVWQPTFVAAGKWTDTQKWQHNAMQESGFEARIIHKRGSGDKQNVANAP